MSRKLISMWVGELNALSDVLEGLSYREPQWQLDDTMQTILTTMISTAETIKKHLGECEEDETKKLKVA